MTNSFVKIKADELLKLIERAELHLQNRAAKEWDDWYQIRLVWLKKYKFISLFCTKYGSIEDYKNAVLKGDFGDTMRAFNPKWNNSFKPILSDLIHAACASLKCGDKYVYLSAEDVYTLDCLTDHYFLNIDKLEEKV